MNAIENEQLSVSARQCMHYGVGELSSFPGLIRKIIKTEAWKERKIKGGEVVTMKGLRELITTKPMRGWGEDPKQIEALLKDDPEVLPMYRDAMKQQGHNQHTSKVDNITPARADKGTSKSYTLSRLCRDHSELFQRVCDGELSANAAAIEAGFRKRPNPDEQCVKAFRKSKDRTALLELLGKELEADVPTKKTGVSK